MKVTTTVFAALFLLFCLVTTVWAGIREEEKVEDAAETLIEIMSIPEESIPPYLLRSAQGIVIIPEVIKVGLVVGGRHGRGILLVRDEEGAWSNPVFVVLTGGSVGWQAGAQSTDVILVLRSRRSVESIGKGRFTLGADASVAAGPVGRHAEVGTDVKLEMEIYSYSRSRGLFAGLAVEGAALQIDDVANADFYDRKGISFNDIVNNEKLEVPEVAQNIRNALERYAP